MKLLYCEVTEYDVTSEMEAMSDALIDIAVRAGPRVSCEGSPGYDPVTDYRSLNPRDWDRAYAYVHAALALGVL